MNETTDENSKCSTTNNIDYRKPHVVNKIKGGQFGQILYNRPPFATLDI